MSGNRIDVVLVKLCAVVIVVLSLQGLTGYVAYFVAGESSYVQAVLAFLLVFLIPVGLAALLWFFPVSTLRLKELEDKATTTLEPASLILVGITLVGLYVLVFGVIDLFYFEAVRVAEATYAGADPWGLFKPSPDTVAGRYTNILQIVIGAGLLLGRKGLANLLAAARYSGTRAS